ncbi:hypothetical protein CPB85DRAFT_177476 [Mucidula mucida]|nr:hypothetical protein CPB85DRAFT_177476 [Mucidula mucida]
MILIFIEIRDAEIDTGAEVKDSRPLIVLDTVVACDADMELLKMFDTRFVPSSPGKHQSEKLLDGIGASAGQLGQGGHARKAVSSQDEARLGYRSRLRQNHLVDQGKTTQEALYCGGIGADVVKFQHLHLVRRNIKTACICRQLEAIEYGRDILLVHRI